MSRCDWASCDNAATERADGWWMCPPHLSAHKEMFPPPVKALPPREKAPQPRQLRPCGTRSAAERHRQNNEPVCASCKEAEAEYYHQRWLRQKQAA